MTHYRAILMMLASITTIIFPTEQFNDFLDVPPLFLLHCLLNLFHKAPFDSHLSLDLPSLLTFKYSALYFPCHLPDQQEKIKPNIVRVYL